MATILVIDDDELVREAVTDILEMYHMNVLTASNGVEGVEIFKNNTDKIDGVIVDRRMPKLNGVATLQKLRAIQKDLPIIMSSGYAFESQEFELGMERPNAYLYKPYEIQELIELIEKVILK